MDDTDSCVRRTQRISVPQCYVPLLLLCVCVCVLHVHSGLNAAFMCGKQKLRHGHFTQINTCTHPTKQACGRQTDRQTPTLTNTWSVYVESCKGRSSCLLVFFHSSQISNHTNLLSSMVCYIYEKYMREVGPYLNILNVLAVFLKHSHPIFIVIFPFLVCMHLLHFLLFNLFACSCFCVCLCAVMECQAMS